VAARQGLTDPILIGCQVVLLSLLVISVGYTLFNVSANMLLGCPPGDSQSEGPAAHLSLVPPGVTCSYELSADAGQLVIGPSPFPTLMALACVAGLLAVRRIKQLSDPWNLAPSDLSDAATDQPKPSH
jgi:hypothetical protein